MRATELERQIAVIASLAEPIRRRLYFYVARRRRDVGRDEAARALRISRALAAFHLDKLVAEGLLQTSYRRLSHRRGPGAGRPAKLYRRSPRQLDVTLPQRRYELAGRVFARVLTDAPSPTARRALARTARAWGRELGAQARRSAGADLLAVLGECGFEPARANGEVRLSNCPFEVLANESRPLVCGMNVALVRGLLAGVAVHGWRARFAPEAGACCVVLTMPQGRSTHRR